MKSSLVARSDDTRPELDRFNLESRDRGRARDRPRPLALDGLPRGVEGGRRLRLLSRPRTASCSSTRSSRPRRRRALLGGPRPRREARVSRCTCSSRCSGTRAAPPRWSIATALASGRRARQERRSRGAPESSGPVHAGDPLPGGIEAYRTARAAEVVYWIPEHSALVPGRRAASGTGRAARSMCPESWLPAKTTTAISRRRSGRCSTSPIRRVLVSHGKPGPSRAAARALGARAETL